MRTRLLVGLGCLAAMVLSSAASAQEKVECPLPVKPGVSIGGVRLGMSLDEAKAAGSFIAPGKGEAPVWRLVHPAGNWSFKLGTDKRVEEVALETSRPCLDDGPKRIIDMTERAAQLYAPLPDCGGQGGGGGGGWNCSEHGTVFWWGPSSTSVIIRRPGQMQPFKEAPPPLPKPPAKPPKAALVTATVPAFASTAAGDAGVKAAAVPAKAAEPEPVDPCTGNWSPAPGIACGFFGRSDSLSLECYPTHLCMGAFSPKAVAHICVHGANGEPLGAFTLGRGGRSLAYRFEKPTAVGTPVRVYVDRDVRVLPPANSYQGPKTPAEPAHDPKVVGVAASFVHGGRPVANGWVLDLQVPSSAGQPAAMVEKKVE
ncbi:MAG TPA: hypothetical protein VGK67_10380 [Myxococcales bacterium]